MANKRPTEDDLKNMGLVWDEEHRAYIKRQVSIASSNPIQKIEYTTLSSKRINSNTSIEKNLIALANKNFFKRKLSLTLFGIPMAKQSVRTSSGHFWQPQKTVDRKKQYIEQIKKQLPKDFIPFSEEVFVTRFHCIFPPLKSFHKEKGKMERIRNGEVFYKNTQPDLIDNLKKLAFDCLGKDKKTGIPLVISNDGIIVGEDNTRKYYGIGGCIIIDLEGK